MEQGARTVEALVVHYNTQELTEAAVLSLWKHTPSARVTVFDNSDRRPFDASRLGGRLSVIDNTTGQVVEWEGWLRQFPRRGQTNNDYASAKHCYSVELCMDMFPGGFLLMDSDILLRRDVSPLCDPSQAVTGEIGRASHPKRGGLMRFMPMLCFVNTPLLRAAGASFFNPSKMWALTDRQPDCWYDTGAWLLESVLRAGLPHRTFALSDYALHFGHGSWKNKQDPMVWLRENSRLWDGNEAIG
ncbi:MAG: hypothetical protein IKH15_11760 [Bacteroidales bacterium]|nr:hypothetical protein [Bacteroidales bacterium]